MGYMKVTDVFTTEEIEAAQRIVDDKAEEKHARIVKMLQPSWERIDRETGQENSLPYLAYVLEYYCVKQQEDGPNYSKDETT